MTADETREKIIRAYKKAFESGDGKAWKSYRSLLVRTAKEVGADSPEALEDWAFRTAMILSQRFD